MMIQNQKNKMGGARLLAGLADEAASLALLDPQYRGIMDKMAYGNEGARQGPRARLPQMSDADIALFIEEIGRVLKRSGHLGLWMDKFSMASGRHLQWTRRAPQLERVEMIQWRKTRPGMGKRARGFSEYLLIFQKAPIRAKGIWRDHGIPDSWLEGADRDTHVHAKPIALTTRLINCLTRPRDLVLDPCAGGYGVLDACLATGRNFIGCDLVG